MKYNKYLSGIANNLLRSFVSRNNDIDGYWGIGKLCLLTNECSKDRLDFNLKAGHVYKAITIEQRVAENYHVTLQQLVPNVSALKSAVLSVSFKKINHKVTECVSHNFKCRLELVDSNNKLGFAEINGQCWPHDPKLENKRISENRTSA